MALGVEQARHTHLPSARARGSNGRQEHQEDSSWLCPSELRPASAGGAGCPGCGRLLQPPGPVTAPQNCPSAAYSTASQPLPPPQGLYYRPYCAASYWQPGGRAPRAPRRAHGSQSSNEYCRPAASRLPGGSTRLARRAPAALAAAPAAAALAAAAPAGGRYGRRRPLHPRLPSRARSNEYCRPAASRLPDGSTRLARRAPAALAAAPAAAALAAAAPAGGRYGRRRPLHPRLPSRAPSRRARPTLLVHGTRRHTAAENRRCCARSARDLVLLRLDPAIPRVYL